MWTSWDSFKLTGTGNTNVEPDSARNIVPGTPETNFILVDSIQLQMLGFDWIDDVIFLPVAMCMLTIFNLSSSASQLGYV